MGKEGRELAPRQGCIVRSIEALGGVLEPTQRETSETTAISEGQEDGEQDEGRFLTLYSL